ncbi:MAG: hypothetical protein IJ144_00485 [Prevotella sp.]|nr:hypothetical protein [Prevotella sp.]
MNSFGTYMGRATNVTRAYGDGTYTGGGITNIGKTGGNELSKAEFGVFGYFTGTQNWSAWTKAAPNFMYNQELKYDGTKWYYEPVKYWPNGTDAANTADNPSNTATESLTQYLSFYAYAPYHTLTTTEYSTGDTSIGGDLPTSPAVTKAMTTGETFGIVAMSKNDETTDMQVKYILNNAQEDQAVDLLWGLRGQTTYKETDAVNNSVEKLGTLYNTDLTKQTVDEKVKFLFKHALARIGGSTSTTSSASGNQVCGLKVVLDVDGNSTNSGVGIDNQNNYLNSNFDNTKTLVTIQSVNIRDKYTYSHESTSTIAETESDFLTDGWFDVMTGTWTKTEKVESHTTDSHGATYKVLADNATTGYNLNKDIKEPSGNDVSAIIKSDKTVWEPTGDEPTGVTTGTPKNVYDNEDIPGLLLIPGANTGGNTIYVTVDYFVRTADPNLSTGYTTVRQIITNKVQLDGSLLNPNQYYTIVMHLGLTSVKFEAKVADWSAGVNEEYNEDGTEVNPGDENDRTIWLPSNVVSSTVVTASSNIVTKGTDDKDINIATAGTGTIFDVTGLTAGNDYEITGLASPATYAVLAGGNDVTKKLTSTTLSLQVNGLTSNAGSLTNNTTTVTITEKNSGSTVSTTKVDIIQAADEAELTVNATKTDVVAAGEAINLTIQKTTGSEDKKSEATVTVVDETGTTPSGLIIATGNESITFPANNSSKTKTYTATITVGNVTKTLTFTQAAHDVTLTATPNSGLSATKGAGSKVVLAVNDGAGAINLSSVENTSTITVTKPTDVDVTNDCTITKTTTGATIILPANATSSAITYTIKVKVNNATEATIDVIQVAGA